MRSGIDREDRSCLRPPLPADLQQILLHTLASIAGDNQVTIGRMPEELTSTVAAALREFDAEHEELFDD